MPSEVPHATREERRVMTSFPIHQLLKPTPRALVIHHTHCRGILLSSNPLTIAHAKHSHPPPSCSHPTSASPGEAMFLCPQSSSPSPTWSPSAAHVNSTPPSRLHRGRSRAEVDGGTTPEVSNRERRRFGVRNAAVMGPIKRIMAVGDNLGN